MSVYEPATFHVQNLIKTKSGQSPSFLSSIINFKSDKKSLYQSGQNPSILITSSEAISSLWNGQNYRCVFRIGSWESKKVCVLGFFDLFENFGGRRLRD